MPGPASKPNAVRRNSRVGPVKLPAEGRKGAPPKWPLGRMAAGEKALWAELWATPQSVMWARLGWTRVVARYARIVMLAEGGRADAWAEARQLEDRLGLTPKAMRMLLWEIVSDELADRRADASAESRRSRVKAVE